MTTRTVPTSLAEPNAWAMNDALQPAYTVTVASLADATALVALRQRSSVDTGIAPSFTALVVKAAAMTMQRHPEANRAVMGPPLFRRLVQFDNIDISVAVEKNLPALPGLAYAEPILDTVNKSLAHITQELRALATCDETTNARYALYLRILKYVPRPFSTWMLNAPHWFPSLWAKHRGCACWVNAPSKAGADFVSTTWPWPLTFSFGVVRKRAVVVDDEVQARLTIPLVMVFDRRVMGGGPASRLFADFKTLLENGLETAAQGPVAVELNGPVGASLGDDNKVAVC